MQDCKGKNRVKMDGKSAVIGWGRGQTPNDKCHEKFHLSFTQLSTAITFSAFRCVFCRSTTKGSLSQIEDDNKDNPSSTALSMLEWRLVVIFRALERWRT